MGLIEAELMGDLPVRNEQWAERTVKLYNGIKKLRETYEPALTMTDQILDTLTFVIFGETPTGNDWLDMALSQKETT